ncbi:MAG: ATP synthase F1 subunit delta [Deltaproteobacteria bacterium]|jgi:F-type H+-transporting ATPase subunit delta|nr:ATP synthase F1 subunit delta [Deltaproteobacteria bacterium]
MDSILAKRYAEALLELGLADGNHAAYGEELALFSAAVQGAGEEGRLLASPALPAEARKKILSQILDKASLSPLTRNFVSLLNDRGRFSLLRETARAYAALQDEREGIVRGVVQTAVDLDESQLNGIRSALGIYTGKKVELTQKVDPSIIGGVVARLGDLEVDGSVRMQLNKLKAAFQ